MSVLIPEVTSGPTYKKNIKILGQTEYFLPCTPGLVGLDDSVMQEGDHAPYPCLLLQDPWGGSAGSG